MFRSSQTTKILVTREEETSEEGIGYIASSKRRHHPTRVLCLARQRRGRGTEEVASIV